MSITNIGHYIGGQVAAGASGRSQPVTNPATGAVTGNVALANSAEVAKAVAAAQAAYDKGDYRWAAELLNHAVFGAPDSKAAKDLLARAYDQMGYQSEAATWRNSSQACAAASS